MRTLATRALHPWSLNPVMVRRCERVVRSCIYSLPFYSDGSGNLRLLRLVLASPSRPRSVIIVSKIVRSEGAVIVVVISSSSLSSSSPSFPLSSSFSSSSSSSSSVFASQRERRGTVTLWSSTDVHRDLGWIYVSVYRCRRVWEARGQRGLVAKVGKRFIRPRELPNYTRSH